MSGRQAAEPLGEFMDYCTYGHMIDNVVLIVTGTLHERDVHVRTRKSQAPRRAAHGSAHAAALPSDWQLGASASLCSRESARLTGSEAG